MSDVQRIWLNRVMKDQEKQRSMSSRADGVRNRIAGRMSSRRRVR